VTEWPDQTFSGCYAFLHALYQEVLYQRLAAGRRVQIHRRLGARLEAGYKSQTAEIAPVLALHFEQGRDFAKAMRYLGQAAENSAKRLGNREAVSYLTRALGLVDRLPADQRATAQMALLRQRSWARRSAGDLKGSLEDLNAMISCAAESGQPRMEVSGLLAVSRVCLHADRRQCLRAAELALEKSHALDDEVFKALVQGTSASTNLYLKGWRNEDAELCRHCLRLTADAHDHGTLIRRYGIEGIVKCSTAEYLDCRVAATKGKNMARDIGDVFIFVLFNVLESTALLHLGEWRELRRGTIAALTMAERNANVPATVLCRLTLAWLHVEALDFVGAKQRCEEIEDAVFDANPFAFYFQRAVLAKALVGSRDLAGAATRFDDITRRLDAEGGDLDFTIYTQFHHSLCEYHLEQGELGQARTHAEKLYRYAAPAPDRNHLALAHRLLARTAQAEGDLAEAGIQIERAVATLGDADLPLAAWRVYSTAAAFYESIGDVGRAADYHRRYVAVIHALAANFDEGDPLRMSLLAGLAANAGH
jgi:tetratricopeptide (TPR) repeat protein